MPSGVYFRTLEARMNMSKAKIGKPMSEKVKKKISESNLGEKAHQWKGGRALVNYGYIKIMDVSHPKRDKGDYILEHRIVAEKCLGRYLTEKEVVHHINGIKSDNRPENLYLFETSGKHMSFHFSKVKPVLMSNLINLQLN